MPNSLFMKQPLGQGGDYAASPAIFAPATPEADSDRMPVLSPNNNTSQMPMTDYGGTPNGFDNIEPTPATNVQLADPTQGMPQQQAPQPAQQMQLAQYKAKEDIAHAGRNFLKSDEGRALYDSMSKDFPQLAAINNVVNPPDIYKEGQTQTMRFSPQQRIEQALNVGQLGGNPMQIAQAYLGKEESRDRAVLGNFFKKSMGEKVDPQSTPWCAAFANSVLMTGGLPGTGSLAARSFLNYGEATKSPSQGDVVVLSRGKDTSKGHVGFYAGERDGQVLVLGGNQGNRVSIKSYPMSSVVGFRKPPQASEMRQAVSDTTGVGQSQDPKTIDRTMAAIRSIESGESKHPYSLISKASKNGDRAYGAHQIMGSNIGPWSKEALGRRISKEEFLSNPDIQDQVAKHQVTKLVNKYGPEGAARAWFAGEGGMNKMHRKDAYGTSVKQYNTLFKSRYDQ